MEKFDQQDVRKKYQKVQVSHADIREALQLVENIVAETPFRTQWTLDPFRNNS